MTLWQRSFLRPAAKARITLNKTISVQSLRPFSFSKFFCPKRDLLKQILFWTMVTSQSKKTPLAVISEPISLGKRYLSRHFDALLEFSNTIHLFYYLFYLELMPSSPDFGCILVFVSMCLVELLYLPGLVEWPYE